MKQPVAYSTVRARRQNVKQVWEWRASQNNSITWHGIGTWVKSRQDADKIMNLCESTIYFSVKFNVQHCLHIFVRQKKVFYELKFWLPSRQNVGSNPGRGTTITASPHPGVNECECIDDKVSVTWRLPRWWIFISKQSRVEISLRQRRNGVLKKTTDQSWVWNRHFIYILL